MSRAVVPSSDGPSHPRRRRGAGPQGGSRHPDPLDPAAIEPPTPGLARGGRGGGGGRAGRPQRGGRPDKASETTVNGGAANGAKRYRNRPRPPHTADTAPSSEAGTSTTETLFENGSTETASASQPRTKSNRRGANAAEKISPRCPKANDLKSTLIYALSTRPYPDCPICFVEIYPQQKTWSCSPSLPISPVSNDHKEGSTPKGTESAQCCWTTFHLKCIRSWASKSVKEVADAWRARGEQREGEWRCPGCQSKRTLVPSGYWCFCGSTPEPKPSSLATPHSCGNACSRPRVCGHACPDACHPGPCPPCQVTTRLPCHCGREVLSFRCAHFAPDKAGQAAELSCGQRCGKLLGCGNHACEAVCHEGPCAPCAVREGARCYCGREDRGIGCGEGEERMCVIVKDGKETRWVGRFACESTCDRPFDCGVHRCSKPCHPPSPTPAPCPRSPSLVTHCPCGKHELAPSSSPFFPSGTLLTRTACTDVIPTCESTCMKPLERCAHVCSARCHTGPCPPCMVMLVRPCRCGATTRNVACAEDQERTARVDGSEILCDRQCGALRACGRHQCNRLCCPLASLASVKGKGKKRAGALEDTVVDEAGWHECDLVCGKMLGCGNHRCEARDHRGVCAPCLRSSFEEMICHCGRTILEPPIPCGTRINCPYPCARPPPPCGHPKAQHACHEDPAPCPPCPFLASKRCACGKKMVDNVQCSREKVSCGTTCGKLLGCGFHHCERLCHGDDCGPCTAVCGKARKLCLPAHHPCALPCHAPASCSEAEPCRTIINVTCPCGRIRQPIQCGRSLSNPAGREGSQQIKCTNECLVAKRNARLAEALGISPDRAGTREQQATYNDELLAFARLNPKFCITVEKSLADFLASDKKSHILPHMPEQRRKFVHDLAFVYRTDTNMVDQEPNRSVQLIKRIDSRVPSPLLSAVVAVPPSSSGASTSTLGRLADLRAPTVQQAPRQRVSPTPTPMPVAGGSAMRGWTSVVAYPPPSASAPATSTSVTPGSRKPPGRPGPPRLVQLAAPAAQNSTEDVPDDWEDDT
ncbi:hypothetical protein B0H21DRAFT_837372 [Amylocystis lapponica]|nr:hypothetical protein B0H21DRAFT_837372 [Amylocystis lapponica]